MQIVKLCKNSLLWIFKIFRFKIQKDKFLEINLKNLKINYKTGDLSPQVHNEKKKNNSLMFKIQVLNLVKMI